MIPEEKLAEIRDRAPIAELIGEYVTLKKSGTSYKGLCPFHNEKTPSFYVHPHRGFYHCFGCKASGDIFSFMKHVEGKTFPEVARMLAERTGVELPSFDPEADAKYQRARKQNERLASLMDAATDFYVEQLRAHKHAGIARAELERRGVSAETAASFRLGYAPEGWDHLVRFLDRGGWSPAEAESLGLIVPRKTKSGHYDRFRHRLMFPITDLHGRVVAFSGRALDPAPGAKVPDEKPAKYVNSPEGPLYKKGAVLYGLHEGRVEVRRAGLVFVCEGNFDLVALHQAGLVNSVAPMGTAFTAEHAKLLKRFTQNIVLLFDGDAAGRKAVRESFGILNELELATRVVTLPHGTDPDSFIREHGADALNKRVEQAPTIVEFLVDDAAEHTDPNPHAKGEAIASLAPMLAKVESPIERRLYVERVAKKFGIADIDLVRRELRRGLKGKSGTKRGNADRRPEHTPTGLQSKLISILIDHPRLALGPEARKLPELLTSTDLRAIFESILRMMDAQGALDATGLLEEHRDSSLKSWLESRLAVQEYDEGTAEQAMAAGVRRLAQQQIEQRLPQLQQRIVEARRAGDDQLAQGLTQEFVTLSQSAHQLRQRSTNKR